MGAFLSVYGPSVGQNPFPDIHTLVTAFNWTTVLATTTAEYFDSAGVNGTFTREQVEAALRVNYGQVSVS